MPIRPFETSDWIAVALFLVLAAVGIAAYAAAFRDMWSDPGQSPAPPPPPRRVRRRLVTRRRMAELNAQDWADFRAHWPMRLLDLATDFGAGLVLGLLLGFALLVYVLQRLAS